MGQTDRPFESTSDRFPPLPASLDTNAREAKQQALEPWLLAAIPLSS
jgi:hypothetical protein